MDGSYGLLITVQQQNDLQQHDKGRHVRKYDVEL